MTPRFPMYPEVRVNIAGIKDTVRLAATIRKAFDANGIHEAIVEQCMRNILTPGHDFPAAVAAAQRWAHLE